MPDTKTCINCLGELIDQRGVWICPHCNSNEIDQVQGILEPFEDDDYVVIECPGATLYAPGTTEVVAGVRWHDDDDPLKGYKIIGHPVYAPDHRRRRRIKREALGKIRRCRACQDYTIRMRRKEGPDFCAPSSKHPRRKKLKSVSHLTYEP
jgi:hypothetical protein